MLKKILVVFVSVLVLSGPVMATCGGTLYQDGCSGCGFLWLSKYKWYKKTVAYRASDGTCQTQTTTTENSCGSC